MKHTVLMVLGTRPEAVKLLPLYFALKEARVHVLLCITSQHSHLLRQVLDLFCVTPDYDFLIMQENQSLAYINAIVLEKCSALMAKIQPGFVIVQGDTTTAFAAAQAAFYHHIPVGHVEAGLRTYDMQAPFPEEFNRCAIALIARYHFAPTQSSVQHLLAEKRAPSSIFLTGNTIVDALIMIKKKLDTKEVMVNQELVSKVEYCRAQGKKIILLTVHRRESFSGGLYEILSAIKDFAKKTPQAMIFYPMHPNPVVVHAVKETQLGACENIIMLEPMRYEELVFLLDAADFVASDSGGIQEEAVSLGKTILVLREKTERNEGVKEGFAYLVGTKYEEIMKALEREYRNDKKRSGSGMQTIYGDGAASKKIVACIQSVLARSEGCSQVVNQWRKL